MKLVEVYTLRTIQGMLLNCYNTEKEAVEIAGIIKDKPVVIKKERISEGALYNLGMLPGVE